MTLVERAVEDFWPETGLAVIRLAAADGWAACFTGFLRPAILSVDEPRVGAAIPG